jgi:hypothetical protein
MKMSSNAGRCARCHRLLKDPVSIALGMGPECRQRTRKPRTAYAHVKSVVAQETSSHLYEPIDSQKHLNLKRNHYGYGN